MKMDNSFLNLTLSVPLSLRRVKSKAPALHKSERKMKKDEYKKVTEELMPADRF
ncbi:MAG: hypothetical protein LBT25_03820 [Candidatus Symbiothrix sp.]|jgi:hypothetical protein|nr:hypothetical protein [Candidatus Symbiothrix sp.]